MVKRGDVVVVALSGDYGKPRPALVVQSDNYEGPSVTILPITGHLSEGEAIRIDASPSDGSGLHKASQIMVDKIQTLPRGKIGRRIGVLDVETLVRVDRALAAFLGLA